MPTDQLHITLIQPDIVWESKDSNLRHYESLIDNIDGRREIVVLPEMFSTGFSMEPERLAEPMDGPSVNWMKDMAAKHRCILTGSLIIEEGGQYFNRLIWMQPNGQFGIYDKRHLFGYAREDEHYAPGRKRLLVSVNGWRISPLICYDLRFPVWSRNVQPPTMHTADTSSQTSSAESPNTPYDVLLYVANWPERRSLAWKTLLQARAIENQAFVVGVNRVGTDGKNISYSGDSAVYGPLGEIIWQQSGEAAVQTVVLDKNHLIQTRSDFPFLKDADQFILL